MRSWMDGEDDATDGVSAEPDPEELARELARVADKGEEPDERLFAIFDQLRPEEAQTLLTPRWDPERASELAREIAEDAKPTASAPTPGLSSEPAAEREASEAAPEMSRDTAAEASVEADLKQEIATVAEPAARQGRSKAQKAEVDAAYADLRAWTNAQASVAGNPDTVRAKQNLETKWQRRVAAAAKKGAAAPTEAEKATYFAQNFFQEYWMLHCDQFANELTKRIHGDYPSLARLRAKTNQAIDEATANGQSGAVDVAGRDIRVRGLTVAELGLQLDTEGAEPGIGVHVKMRPAVDRPYDPNVSDEFHHWFVYVGGGLFSDSFGANKDGAACDKFMLDWVKRSFHNRGRSDEAFDFSPLHTPEYADPASLERWQALVGSAEQALAEARALPEGDKAEKRAKRQAVATAKQKLAKGERTAKKEKLPQPGPAAIPRVTAIYRPVQAKQAAAKPAPKP